MIAPQKSAAKTIGLGVLAGLIAGGILAILQIVLVRPLVDAISGDWLSYQTANGLFDEDLFNRQMQTIYLNGLAGSLAWGLGGGALIGTILAFSNRLGLAGRNTTRGSQVGLALAIASVLWFVLAVVPAIKYPPDPFATFDPAETASFDFLLAAYITISGTSALGSVLLFGRFRRRTKWFGAGAVYLGLIAGISVAFPEVVHQDQPFNQAAVVSWRAATSIANTAFWLSLGIVAGLLTDRGAAEKLVDQQKQSG